MSVETILQTIENEIANLTQARKVLAGLNGSSSKAAVRSSTAGRFSAASRATMAAAQKARWTKYRANKGQAKTTKPARIMSAPARRKIAAAQKARWAKVRTSKKAA